MLQFEQQRQKPLVTLREGGAFVNDAMLFKQRQELIDFQGTVGSGEVVTIAIFMIVILMNASEWRIGLPN